MSSTMISGSRSQAKRIASSAVSPWPTIVKSGSPRSVWATPSRNSGWSSTMAIWMLSFITVFYRLQRQLCDHLRARATFALDSEEAPQTLHPLAHSNQAQVLVAAGQLRRIKARSLIRNLDNQLACFAVRSNLLVDPTSMEIRVV